MACDNADIFEVTNSIPRNLLLVMLVPTLLAIAFQTFPESVQVQFRYDRAAIGAGEWWRWVSGHFLHLSWVHLALNLAGLLLIVTLFWRYWSVRRLIIIFLFSLLAVDIGLWWFSPEVDWYVGLSGILHGLLIAGALFALHHERTFSIVIMILVIGKLAWEQITRSSPGMAELIGGNVLLDAHLYGFIGGLVASALIALLHTRR